ncbi:hypothetical protein ABH961_004508 [Bacillus sp. RC251]
MKMKKMILTGAVLAATTLTSLTNVQADTTFKDVPTDHWSYKAIMDLKEKNIVAGYGNGILVSVIVLNVVKLLDYFMYT